MTDPAGEQRPPIRIGTAERNAALAALDAHLEAGRLDAMEYGERSARVAEARTVDEVRPLFLDLPAPHPELTGASGPGGPAGVATTASAAPAPRSNPVEVWGPRIAAVMPFVALALFFAVPGPNAWIFFLLIPAAGVLFAGSRDADGDGITHGDARRARRDEHRRHHDEHRRRRHDDRWEDRPRD